MVRIHGNARMTTGNNVWQPLKVGALVGAGTVIQTAKDSYVDLVLGDNNAEIARSSGGSGGSAGTGGGGGGGHASAEQNTIRIKADSALGIDKLTTMQTGADVVTETQLDVQRGKILGNTKKMSAASKYEVKVPNGVAGVRGQRHVVEP